MRGRHVELLLGQGAVGAARLSLDAAPVDVVVFDERHDAAVQFAAELESRGAIALSTRGEVVTHWRACALLVGDQWNAGALSVRMPFGQNRVDAPHRLRLAGLTQHSDFELLRAFAAGLGLRVLHEARHVRRESGEMRHSLSCVRNDQFIAACGSAQWPRQLARAMVNARLARREGVAPLSPSLTGFPPLPPHLKSSVEYRAGALTSCLLG
jgi:hypothetical protein